MKASMEYQASGDLGPLQPDTPQNSVRSLLNTLLLRQAPNQVDMYGNTKLQNAQMQISVPAHPTDKPLLCWNV